MRRRRRAGVGVGFALTTGLLSCADDGAVAPLAESLCPTVQAWSDSAVDAVDAFRIASRDLDPTTRRVRYAQAFVEIGVLHDRLADELDDLELPDTLSTHLDAALAAAEAEVDDGLTEADALPDSAYDVRAVRDGSLLVAVEKAKAVVFNTLGDLAHEAGSPVPPGCGRRGALDLSPSATFPP